MNIFNSLKWRPCGVIVHCNVFLKLHLLLFANNRYGELLDWALTRRTGSHWRRRHRHCRRQGLHGLLVGCILGRTLVLLHTVHELAERSTLVKMDLHRFAFLVMIHEHATMFTNGQLVLVRVNVISVETPRSLPCRPRLCPPTVASSLPLLSNGSPPASALGAALILLSSAMLLSMSMTMTSSSSTLMSDMITWVQAKLPIAHLWS